MKNGKIKIYDKEGSISRNKVKKERKIKEYISIFKESPTETKTISSILGKLYKTKTYKKCGKINIKELSNLIDFVYSCYKCNIGLKDIQNDKNGKEDLIKEIYNIIINGE